MRCLRALSAAWLLIASSVAACGTSTDDSSPSGGVAGTEPGGPGGSSGTTPPNGADGGTTTGEGGTTDGEPPPVPYKHFDVNHVLSTGQSNSVAHEGRPILSTTQPYANLMFDVGVMTSGTCEREGCRTYQKPSAFVPLTEGDSFWYPVETMSSGMANQVAKLAKEKLLVGKPSHDVLVSLAGRNGLTYWCLRKGGCNFIDPTYLHGDPPNVPGQDVRPARKSS